LLLSAIEAACEIIDDSYRGHGLDGSDGEDSLFPPYTRPELTLRYEIQFDREIERHRARIERKRKQERNHSGESRRRSA